MLTLGFRTLRYEWYDHRRGTPNGLLYLILAGVVTGVTAIFLPILIAMRKRIRIVVQLYREASKAMDKMPFILLQPVWSLIAMVGGVGGIVVIFQYLQTAGDPIVDPVTGYVEFPKVGQR